MSKTVKSVIIFLAVVAAPVLAWAAFQWNGAAATVWNGASISAWNGATVGSSCADSSCTGFLVCQNFEGTGYDNSETGSNGWCEYTGGAGIVNEDYTTSPLRGSQSLRMKDDPSEGTWAIRKWATGTVNEQYGFFRLKVIDLPSDQYEVLQTYYVPGDCSDPGALEAHENIWILPSASNFKIHIVAGGHVGDGSTLYSLNTVYYVWYYFSRDSSYRSTGWVKVGTTKSIPATNEIEWTNYTSGWSQRGSNSLGFTMFHGGGYEYVVDQVLVKTTAIGDVCE